jgi:hypothetical protein
MMVLTCPNKLPTNLTRPLETPVYIIDGQSEQGRDPLIGIKSSI